MGKEGKEEERGGKGRRMEEDGKGGKEKGRKGGGCPQIFWPRSAPECYLLLEVDGLCSCQL